MGGIVFGNDDVLVADGVFATGCGGVDEVGLLGGGTFGNDGVLETEGSFGLEGLAPNEDAPLEGEAGFFWFRVDGGGTCSGSGTSSMLRSSRSSPPSSEERTEAPSRPDMMEEAPPLPGPTVPDLTKRESTVARKVTLSDILKSFWVEADGTPAKPLRSKWTLAMVRSRFSVPAV